MLLQLQKSRAQRRSSSSSISISWAVYSVAIATTTSGNPGRLQGLDPEEVTGDFRKSRARMAEASSAVPLSLSGEKKEALSQRRRKMEAAALERLWELPAPGQSGLREGRQTFSRHTGQLPVPLGSLGRR